MYREKLTFDGNALRTTRINEAVHFIYMMNSNLEAKKNRTTGKNSKLSCEVGLGVRLSNFFIQDLKNIDVEDI